jgi:hypothetical protein
MYMPAHLKSPEYQIKMINYPECERAVIYFLQTSILPTSAQEGSLSQRKIKENILRGGRHKNFTIVINILILSSIYKVEIHFLYLLKQIC